MTGSVEIAKVGIVLKKVKFGHKVAAYLFFNFEAQLTVG